MATPTYDVADYARDPWDVITQDERPWYDPLLRELYMRRATYSPFTTKKIDLRENSARTVYFDDLVPMRPNIAVLADREVTATRLYTDSYRRKVETERHGNGISLHRNSQQFSYWRRNGNAGLWDILSQSLAQALVDEIDLLARNAMLTNPFRMYGLSNNSGFNQITTSDLMTTDVLDAIRLGMEDRKPTWAAYDTDYNPGELICITSPGVLFDLRKEATDTDNGSGFTEVMKYANPSNLITGEVGMYRGVRFIKSQLAILWNCGPTTVQTTIKAAVKPGQGAPDPDTTAVDGVRYVGQPDATHTITVADTTGFAAGQKVTVHKLRISDPATVDGRGVVNGPDFRDPQLQDLEIYEVVDGTHLTFKEPYMMTGQDGLGLETDLGGTVYGYVTLGRNIHTSVFLNRNQLSGVIGGIAQLPQFYMPDPYDDYLSIYRLAYDFFMKFQLWDPGQFEVFYSAGSNKSIGATYIR